MVEVGRYERTLGPVRLGLRRDLRVTRQVTRRGPRYVIHDPIAFSNHAFTAGDYRVLTAIVPQQTLAEVFARLAQDGVVGADDKQGFYEFVLWLHDAALVQLPIGNPDALFERYQRKQASRRSALLRAFLSLRVPLCNPDAFLQRTLRYTGWLFGAPGLIMWCGLLLLVAWKCLGRFGELFGQSADMLRLANLPVLWLALVGLKALHEFGHAYACRKRGGAVPEMGVVFILMTPCAYVDATSSWQLDRRGRIAVALGGMYVESIVAGIFALVWAGTQPGLMHDLALNVVVLASVTTLLLNINPLMKFDGYY
ncbi:MAG: hypothetical protein KDC87_12860, partial [Planctomycetes bacterium]|nr:hypothetical protein [Planctomycetota bacterium]